jgi:hypothetical protein
MRCELELVHNKSQDIFPSCLSERNGKAVGANVFCFRRPSQGYSSGSMPRNKSVCRVRQGLLEAPAGIAISVIAPVYVGMNCVTCVVHALARRPLTWRQDSATLTTNSRLCELQKGNMYTRTGP